MGPDLTSRLRAGGYDAAFICAHGPGGEDGTVQELCEMLGLPYTGAGVSASARCFDKALLKDELRRAGIATPPWLSFAGPALAPAGRRRGAARRRRAARPAADRQAGADGLRARHWRRPRRGRAAHGRAVGTGLRRAGRRRALSRRRPRPGGRRARRGRRPAHAAGGRGDPPGPGAVRLRRPLHAGPDRVRGAGRPRRRAGRRGRADRAGGLPRDGRPRVRPRRPDPVRGRASR